MAARRIVLDCGVVSTGDDGIITVALPPGTRVTLEMLRDEIMPARRALRRQGERDLLLVDMRGVRAADRDAREYGRCDEVVAITQALALVVDGPVSALIARFFAGINRPDHPVTIVASMERARSWLLSQR